MKPQSSQNYLRFYTAHHFVFYPIIMILIGFSMYFACTTSDFLIWIFISLILVVITALSLMLRQHYALILQDRIIRLELAYRYFTLTGKRFEIVAATLNDGQIFSLRFSEDDQLESLTARTVDENLSPKKIKQLIQNWRSDNHRV